MLNLLWLIPIIPANRAMGTNRLFGINIDYPRYVIFPIVCAIIGTCLTLATGREWYWLFIFGALFFVGRSPTVATMLNLSSGNNISAERDSWATKWCTRLARGSAFKWTFLRAAAFYMPLFLMVSGARGIIAGIAYGICCPLCYRYIPIKYSEWATCVCFVAILACIA